MNVSLIEQFKKPLIRKKLWEIPELFHCSIAGTCLTLEEAKKIIIKGGCEITGKTRDFEIHGTIVSSSKEKNSISNIMQKTLENKFAREISDYASIKTEEELKTAWQESFVKGDIAGAYWAVMTHPVARDQFLAAVFGEVHMLSHINGASGRGNIEKVHMLESIIDKLKEDRSTHKKRIKDLEKMEKAGKTQSEEIAFLKNELCGCKKELQELNNSGTYSILFNELFLTANMYETEKYNREKVQSQLSESNKQIEEMKKENSSLKDENTRLKEELYYLEREFESYAAGDNENHHDNCADCEHDKCRCGGIKGCTILYVGGKSSAIPHFRAVVEKKGGNFIHHDGGQENNMSLLAKAIGRADTVFCPLDCVSHNACQMIKKICQQNQKKFVILRSSGVSSLVRELGGHDRPLGLQ